MPPEPIPQDRCRMLVDAAWAATAQAFLTKAGGTRYGAAVLANSSRVFTAGQYSSFNHVTNVHAEQAALVLASLAGEPDVLALALATTADEDIARPCGVCRQVMVEHASRTGRDFEVLMARRAGGFERARVSELLPWSWQSRTQADFAPAGTVQDVRHATIRANMPTDGAVPKVGDHVVLPGGCMAMVWEPRLQPEIALTKIKYAPLAGGGLRKVAHSFTQAVGYESELDVLGWARPTCFGATAAVAHVSELSRHLAMPAFADCRAEAPAGLRPLLERAGIDEGRIAVSGSRCLCLHRADSDWDLVLRLTPEEVSRMREVLAAALTAGNATIPERSSTWKLLENQFPGRRAALVAGRRFVETVQMGGTQVALIFVPPTPPTVCLEGEWWATGRHQVHGTVTDASLAAYKRAIFRLRLAGGAEIEVVSYHKTANLVRAGDRLALRGWGMRSRQGERLLQLSPLRDNIVWLEGSAA